MSFVRDAPSEQGHSRRANHDLVLSELPLQLEAIATPPCRVDRFRHNLEHDDIVMNRLATARRRSLGRRPCACGYTPETVRKMCADRGILFGAERSSAIVVKRQKYFDQMHRRPSCFRSEAVRTQKEARP